MMRTGAKCRQGKKTSSIAQRRVRLAALASVEPLEGRLFLSTANASLVGDASVRNDLYADTNFGGSKTLFVQAPVTAASDTQIAFLKFDISNATSAGSATLQLDGKLAASGDPAIQTQVFAVADTSWTEGSGTGSLLSIPDGITWNTQPAIGVAISNVVTTSTSKLTPETFDITNYVQQQLLLGNTVISLAIESTTQAGDLSAAQIKKTGAGIVDFDSQESTVPPVLAIQSSNVPPGATLQAANVTLASTAQTVVAEYTSSSAIDLTTIIGGPEGNLKITGHSGASIGPVSVDSSDPDDVFATYSVIPPNGTAWAVANNGSYTVTLLANQVRNVAGVAAASISTTFTVSVKAPDTTPPVARIQAASITTATFAPAQITVVYTDNVAVDPSTITASSISVTGPSGPLTVAGVALSSSTSAPAITATYTVNAPGNGWSYLANGSYAIALAAGRVKDASANAAAAASSALTVSIPTPASPNDLSFDNGSSVSLPFTAQASATLADGETVVVGFKGNLGAGTSQGVIELLIGDGSVNTSFGTNGFITTPLASNDAFYSVIPQGSGFVVGGSDADGAFLLQRYLPTGSLDASFGQGGAAIANFGSSSQAVYSLAISPAGNILAGGTAAGNFAFADYDASGNLVSTWGQNGEQLFDLGSNLDVVGKVGFQSNGDLVAVGATNGQVAVVRLNSSGIADATFGSSGLVIVPGLVANTAFTAGDHTEGLAIEPDDSILVANQTAGGHFGLAHLDANGNAISSFGTNGVTAAAFGGTDDADSVFVQGNGNIIVTGTTNGSNGLSTAIAEFDANGRLVPTFGLLGQMTVSNPASGSSAVVATGGATTTFASQNANGRLLIGTAGTSAQSALRGLNLSGAPAVGSTPLGSFGPSGRKNIKLTIPVNGVQVTLGVIGGTGEAFMSNGGLSLAIAAGSKGATLIIQCKGGSRSVTLGGVGVTGSLRLFSNRSVNLAGTLSATGMIGNLTLGSVTASSITAGGNINALTLGSAADTTVSVNAQSRIKAINVKTIDSLTRFIAGSFAIARIPRKVDPKSDSHFQIL